MSAGSAVPVTLRMRVVRRFTAVEAALALCGVVVIVALAATTVAVARGTPRLGLLTASDGRVLALDPAGAAARAGIRPGDTITAVDGRPIAGQGFAALAAPIRPGHIAITEGRPGSFTLFWAPVAPPSSSEQEGDVAALFAAAFLALTVLLAGTSPGRTPVARLYALSALALALAVCAAIGQDSASPWAWLAFHPALLVGLGALALTEVALARPLSKRIAVSAMLLCALCAVGALAATLAGVSNVIAVAIDATIALLALTIVAIPLALHGRTVSEPARRRLRVALVAAITSMLPVLLWLAVTVLATAPGASGSTLRTSPISPLWSLLGLVALGTAHGALVSGANTRRLDAIARQWLACMAAAVLCALAVVAVTSSAPFHGYVLPIAVALLLVPFVQRAIDRGLQRAVYRPPPDYGGARRWIEAVAARSTSREVLAIDVMRRLPAFLQVRSAALVVRASDESASHYQIARSDSGAMDALEWGPDVTWPDDETPRARVFLPARTPLPSVVAALLQRLDAAVYVLLWWDGEARGLLVLGHHVSDERHDARDLTRIGDLGNIVGLALRAQDLSARLERRTRALARVNHRLAQAHEQERAHLSRELHDVVAQELIALTRQLRRFDSSNTPPPEIWADMLAASQDALTATRRICNGLRPAILDLGLVPALRDLASEAGARDSDLEIDVTVRGAECRLTGELEFALYRVAQEGLNNAVVHGHAHRVRLEADFDDQVALRVRDDGRGFVVPDRFQNLPGDHLGLLGMQDRVATLGGTLTVSSSPGKGAVLEVRFPTPTA